MARVLGVDPGTLAMGYGVVEEVGDTRTALAWGVLTASAHLPLPQRLHTLYQQLQDTIAQHQPTEVAVEEPFTARNPRSALAVGQALALALLAAADHGLPVHTYPPALIKQAVTNYGRSTKEQVREMVCIHLGTSGEMGEHAADALAIALCRLQEGRLEARLAAPLMVIDKLCLQSEGRTPPLSPPLRLKRGRRKRLQGDIP